MTDPVVFLDDYLGTHEMKKNLDCPAERECMENAEEARQSFKRARRDASSSESDEPENVENLSKEAKYNRRLVNNRRSAAASRVYREALRKWRAYKLYESSRKVEQLQLLLCKAEQEAASLRTENSRLKNSLANAGGNLLGEAYELSSSPRAVIVEHRPHVNESVIGSTTTDSSELSKVKGHKCIWKPLSASCDDAEGDCCSNRVHV